MNEEAKKKLKDRIDADIFRLTHENWKDIYDRDRRRSIRLEEAIDDAQDIIFDLYECFNALKELDPNNE